jgi:hypothetical protein
MFVLWIEGKCLLIICKLIIKNIWACPRKDAAGSGFSLQVLAIRASWLWAFHFNPSRRLYISIRSVNSDFLKLILREGLRHLSELFLSRQGVIKKRVPKACVRQLAEHAQIFKSIFLSNKKALSFERAFNIYESAN